MAAPLATRVTVEWLDRYGQTSKLIFHVSPSIVSPTDTVITDIVSAFLSVMRGKPIRITLTAVTQTGNTPTASVYQSVQDKATFTFADQNGQAHTFRIPAPVQSIFNTDDNETVDQTVMAVGNFIDIMQTDAVGEGGAGQFSWRQGHRTAARKLIKI